MGDIYFPNSWIKRIVDSRERNGSLEYKVHWKDSRYFSLWIERSRFENLDLVAAFDAEKIRIKNDTRRLMEHEAQKTKNMKILKASDDGVQVLVSWSGQTWEDVDSIPKEVMELWREEYLLNSPPPITKSMEEELLKSPPTPKK